MDKQSRDSLTDFIMTVAFIALVIFVVKARDAQRVSVEANETPAIEREVYDAVRD